MEKRDHPVKVVHCGGTLKVVTGKSDSSGKTTANPNPHSTRLRTFLEEHNNIGITELINVPIPVWTFMVAPFSEPEERRNNWEALLVTCWGLRNYLRPLFEVEEPREKYLPLLQGYYLSCNSHRFEDEFVKIEGDKVEVLVKTASGGSKKNGSWGMRKVTKGNNFHIEMNVIGDMRVAHLPELVFQRFPKIPYPVKVNKGLLRKVEKSEYEIKEKEVKQFRPVRCMMSFGGRFSNNNTCFQSDIALELFQQVPKDFEMRSQLMCAMSEMIEDVSYKFQREMKVMTEQQQKEELIKEMTKKFPSLSSILH